MSSSSSLGLPPVPSSLKPIIPFLQRAHELTKQDPIIAYWSAYHAAQLGISLKTRDPAARSLLFTLLGTLEGMKKEIGPHDALDIESVSFAYVENFALKVFVMADNEDRSGNATRSTAKKFLAAANFFEVLQNYPKSEISEATQEKIKYAKWKAADIARAFREGRKPNPGPAGSDPDPAPMPPASPPSPMRTSPTEYRRSSPPLPLVFQSLPEIDRTSLDSPHASQMPFTVEPPPSPRHVDHAIFINAEEPDRPARWGGEGEADNWSTAATPGTAQSPQTEWTVRMSPTKAMRKNTAEPKSRRGSGSSTGSVGNSGDRASVNEEELGPDSAQYSSSPHNWPRQSLDVTNRSYTPSIMGGLSDSPISSSSIRGSPSYDEQDLPRSGASFIETSGGLPLPAQGTELISPYIPPLGFTPDTHQVWSNGTLVSPAAHPFNSNVFHSLPHVATVESSSPQHYPSPPEPLFELTPGIIAKAQKHCRFAISALDYEDAEQARKELRAALAILGG